MLTNYLKIAWRNLIRNKVYSVINVGGLAVGMAVAILIGLWVWDELSFDKQAKNYDRIAQLWQFVTFDAEKSSYDVLPMPLAAELRANYPDFESVSLSNPTGDVILALSDKKITKTGQYVEPDFLNILSVKMLAGSHNSLADVNSILLSESVAQMLFGTANPLNRLIKLNDKVSLKVTGIYEDFPANSSFKDALFLAPWRLNLAINQGAKKNIDQWDNNNYRIIVQLKSGASVDKVSAKIRDIRMKRENPPPYKPEFFLHPMSQWHLYSEFRNGVSTGGLIQFVWLFGTIGGLVLLLACINFMNLSTARSEKRAKEVGIRKAVGSVRSQLISQFFGESFLVVGLAFGLAVGLVAVSLDWFNQLAQKQITMPWLNGYFWLTSLGFIALTGLLAGSYPAVYLSGFQPIRALKGAMFRVGRWATLPRKAMVVLQFTVSVSLIIGTIIVLRQIEFAKDRPVGYNRAGLIEVSMNTPALYGHYEALRTDLMNTRAIADMAESWGSVTVDNGGTPDISWPGKTPDMHPLLMENLISHDYGKTIGWQLENGRDFSKVFTTDSSGIILNQSALKLMGLPHPIGTLVKLHGKEYRVIGIVKDMIKNTPFESMSPSFFTLNYADVNTVTIKLAPQLSAAESLTKVADVFRKYNPAAPFVYKFVDEEYAKKFAAEERIGKLASVFAVIAIFISCLGLFGLASFVAEQRTKEIGIRKVLGASVGSLWSLLSKDFVVLVLIALLIATPLAWYGMNEWLQKYSYRIELSWWIFAAAGTGALAITLLTVSYQAIKAALMNPVKSLRSE